MCEMNRFACSLETPQLMCSRSSFSASGVCNSTVETCKVSGFGVIAIASNLLPSGNALTNNFLKDVGITQDQFNVGQQLLSVGIVLLEIPSNFVLYRLGPRAWISGQIFVWGLIALFQAFQHGYGAFLATRLLLGLGESGFIPASLYCITTFYKRNETSKRFSWFFLGNMIALATSGEIAYGILQMKGVCGLKGWQWLFIIEGLLTIIISFIFMAFFPHSPGRPVPFLGIKYFNERETQMITLRVLADDPSKARKGSNITRAELKAAVSAVTLLTSVSKVSNESNHSSLIGAHIHIFY